MYSQGKGRILKSSKKTGVGGAGGGGAGAREERDKPAGHSAIGGRMHAGLSLLRPLRSSPGESYPGNLLEDIQMSEWKKMREKVLSSVS